MLCVRQIVSVDLVNLNIRIRQDRIYSIYYNIECYFGIFYFVILFRNVVVHMKRSLVLKMDL